MLYFCFMETETSVYIIIVIFKCLYLTRQTFNSIKNQHYHSITADISASRQDRSTNIKEPHSFLVKDLQHALSTNSMLISYENWILQMLIVQIVYAFTR